MRKLFFGALFLFFLTEAFVFHKTAMAFSLMSVPEQGNLLYGSVFEGERLFFDSQEIKISDDGRFVVALPYDAPEEVLFIIRLKKREVAVFVPVKKRQWKKEKVSGLLNEKVVYSEEVQERITRENQTVRQARAKSTEDFFPVCFSMPLQGRISSEFASSRTLNDKVVQRHSGTDIAAKEGTPVKAPAAGFVRLTAKDFFLTGNTVVLDHGYGVFSSYSHLSEITVKEGKFVSKGQIIGKVGSTGRVTGPHLHWVLLWKGIRTDPLRAVAVSAELCPEK